MRTQAIENALKLLIKALDDNPENNNQINNLITKSKIILDRDADCSSVIREMINLKI